jgi:hypothetical protein
MGKPQKAYSTGSKKRSREILSDFGDPPRPGLSGSKKRSREILSDFGDPPRPGLSEVLYETHRLQSFKGSNECLNLFYLFHKVITQFIVSTFCPYSIKSHTESIQVIK